VVVRGPCARVASPDVSRRIVTIVVLVAALAVAVPARAAEPRLDFHGDSMGAQARRQVGNQLDREHVLRLRARERAVIRTMAPGIRILAHGPNRPDIVIVELGSGDANDWHSLARMRQDIHWVLELVRNVPCVRWLSLKTRGVNPFYQGYVRRADDFNRILGRQAALYPNVRVAPYRQWSAANPTAFKADGLHHDLDGKPRFARFLRDVALRCPT
jgi:hypothetical protein